MIGVLALQGAFEAHARSLAALGHEVTLVRSARALEACDGLVLPGGESTVHLKLLERERLVAPLAWFVASGKPVLATCAGLILAASRVLDPEQPSFGFLDVTVRRNGWGRQLASFEARDDGDEIPVVAIRAPRIVDVGPRVRVLATLGGEPILVRERNVTGATFHPELTEDRTVHAAVFGAATSTKSKLRPSIHGVSAATNGAPMTTNGAGHGALAATNGAGHGALAATNGAGHGALAAAVAGRGPDVAHGAALLC